jgi:hypothetical protein
LLEQGVEKHDDILDFFRFWAKVFGKREYFSDFFWKKNSPKKLVTQKKNILVTG